MLAPQRFASSLRVRLQATSLSIGLIACGLLACVSGCSKPVNAPTAASVGTVTLEFTRDDQTKTVIVDNVAGGTTLESVMRSIDEVPIVIRGGGVTAFVQEIDGLATSASEGWTYQADGKFVNEGIGSYELTPPVTITWKFGDWNDSAEASTPTTSEASATEPATN